MISQAQADEVLAALERAGWESYYVGGCVRDTLLGIPPHDFDICTAALPSQTAAVFPGVPMDHTGEKHGTVRLLLPDGEIEITTFRTEGGYADSRHPGWVKFTADVRQDLLRRDFTINAIAASPARGFVDPYGGKEDLKNAILRCVGDSSVRFQEDALRILRGMRFAARFRLRVEKNTMDAMLLYAPLLENISGERIFTEFTGFLLSANFEDFIRFFPIITAVIPELRPCVGFDQRSPHHAYDVYTHIAHVSAAVPADAVLRWAALLHDAAKPSSFTLDETGRGHFKGHAHLGAEMADQILTRLKAPAALREAAVWLVDHHMTPLPPEKNALRRALSRAGEQRLEMLLSLEEADGKSKGVAEQSRAADFDGIRQLLRTLSLEEGRLTLRSLQANGTDMQQLGFRGRGIGMILNELLENVLSGSLSNDRAALLAYAKARFEET